MLNNQKLKHLSGLLTFILPILAYYFTKSDSLAFADAAEFALVSKLGSIAHPPGMPAYIFVSWVWNMLLQLLLDDNILSNVLFSIFCSALATCIFYYTILGILELQKIDSINMKNRIIISVLGALTYALGTTVWYWSNTVEVYAFQMLAFALMLFGLVAHTESKQKFPLMLTALGIGIAASNHHLSIVLFSPFLLFFFTENLFFPKFKHVKKGKSTTIGFDIHFRNYFAVFKNKDFLKVAGITTIITLFFYFWMYSRANQEFLFSFGKPDTISRLFFHIAGGPYWKQFGASDIKDNIVSLNIPYFSKIIFYQYYLFLPILFAGIIFLIKQKSYRLLFIILGYFFLNLYFLLGSKNSTGDSDAYLIPAFFIGSILIVYGLISVFKNIPKLFPWLPLLLLIQISLIISRANRTDFDVSNSILTDLDKSAPKNAVILLADWTTVINYYHARIANDFRKDLIVLNYDIKFTNFRIIPNLYPEFYALIKPEYDAFIKELRSRHPQQIYNTGCSLDTPLLTDLYRNLINKFESISVQRKSHLLFDPKTYYFLSSKGYYTKPIFPIGCLVSADYIAMNPDYVDVSYKWLDSPLMLFESGGHDKTVDIEAMLDFHKRYYSNIQNQEMFQKADKSWRKIKKLQRNMKREMPFVGL